LNFKSYLLLPFRRAGVLHVPFPRDAINTALASRGNVCVLLVTRCHGKEQIKIKTTNNQECKHFLWQQIFKSPKI